MCSVCEVGEGGNCGGERVCARGGWGGKSSEEVSCGELGGGGMGRDLERNSDEAKGGGVQGGAIRHVLLHQHRR